MELSALIAPDNIVHDFRASAKEVALRELASRAAEIAALDATVVLNGLIARERLGSTGIGQGIAIPHARITGLARIICLFARAERPIEFESIDGRPVDLFFVLLIPHEEANDHLAALACVSRRLRDPQTALRLRQCKDPAQIYPALLGA
jgi:PTS system nitrogen regulatory IIA component